MNVLVTGANGFVGKNLVCALENVKENKNRTRPDLKIDEIYSYDLESTAQELDEYCKKADFVFNLAGVNRPKDSSEFMKGNFSFASELLDCLMKNGNRCPVMLSSSVQATLEGRFAGSEYGASKKAGEQLFFDYGKKTGAKTLVYRFPNLFGKWCKPNYNSAVATFCHNVARDLPITVNDRATTLTLVYIDDLVNEMLDALEGKEHRDGEFCFVPTEYNVTLGEIEDLLREFAQYPVTREIAQTKAQGFSSKLFSTYISYLPEEKIAFPLKMNCDERGSFTELMRTKSCGQMSVNVSNPGIVKGNHWHDSKWEYFIVVSGKGLIRLRKTGTDDVLEYYVSGDKIEAVCMLPGYTHEIINLSETEKLVTVMWANECFDPARPDTFFDPVIKEN